MKTTPWTIWRDGFYAWERVTADYLEKVLTSPVVLRPSGRMLGSMMKAKAAHEERVANTLSAIGLPTRREQERMLHAINMLNSRIIDLEEQLAEANQRQR